MFFKNQKSFCKEFKEVMLNGKAIYKYRKSRTKAKIRSNKERRVTMKKLATFSVLVILIMLPVSLAQAEKTIHITFATGPMGGSDYTVGSAMASVINKYTKNIRGSTQATSATVENIKLIDGKNAEFATTIGSTTHRAKNGLKPFDQKMNVRHVLSYATAAFKLISLKKTGFNTINDIQGKRVSLGAPGSGSVDMSEEMLKFFNISKKDIKAEYVAWREVFDALKDRRIDAFFVGSPDPWPPLKKLCLTHDVNLVSFSDATLDNYVKTYPYYSKLMIPAGMYKGIDKNIKTWGNISSLLVGGWVDEEVVYQCTKAIFEHTDELHKVHPILKRVTLDNALRSVVVPLHPGAERYYKEIGLVK